MLNETMDPMREACLNLVLSSDLKGFGRCSSLIASVLRRTSYKLWIKLYCRSFLPETFEFDRRA